MDVVWATAHTRPGWFWTSVHCVRAAPGPLVPGGVALVFRGISNTLCVSVSEELVVAAKDLPVEVVERICSTYNTHAHAFSRVTMS